MIPRRYGYNDTYVTRSRRLVPRLKNDSIDLLSSSGELTRPSHQKLLTLLVVLVSMALLPASSPQARSRDWRRTLRQV